MPPDISQNLDAAARDIPEEVSDWLGRLVLLYGVPFNYLIPAEDMLPEESIRFFFLDPIWIQYLVQGACSVGNTGYGDTIIDRAMNTLVQPDPAKDQQPGPANKAAAGVRDRLRQQYEDIQAPEKGADLAWPLTGFLLRSAVVEGWRGLEVMAYRDLTKAEKQELTETDKLSGEAKAILEEAMRNAEQRDSLRTELDLLRKQSPTEVKKLLTPAELEDLFYRKWTDEKTKIRKAELGDKAQTILDQAAANRTARERLGATLRDFVRNQKPAELKKLLESVGVQSEEDLLKPLVELVKPLKPLRIEQLSQDVMLGLFNGLVEQLVIRQPQEGLHFGLTPENKSYTKTLRDLKTGQILQGSTINLSQNNLMRDQKNKGVINIAALAAEMKDLLANSDQLTDQDGVGKFTSAEFAVQMIEAPGEFTFQPRYQRPDKPEPS